MANNIRRVLVPVDFSAASRAALWRASELASALGASLELLHVLELPAAQYLASEGYVPLPPEFRQDLKSRAGQHLEEWLATASVPTDVHRELREGKPSVEIVEYARAHGSDLIVMGTHGRAGMSHALLGSVTDHVIRTAPCPVLTVRGDSVPAAP